MTDIEKLVEECARAFVQDVNALADEDIPWPDHFSDEEQESMRVGVRAVIRRTLEWAAYSVDVGLGIGRERKQLMNPRSAIADAFRSLASMENTRADT